MRSHEESAASLATHESPPGSVDLSARVFQRSAILDGDIGELQCGAEIGLGGEASANCRGVVTPSGETELLD